jgi:hypothetical protein
MAGATKPARLQRLERDAMNRTGDGLDRGPISHSNAPQQADERITQWGYLP